MAVDSLVEESPSLSACRDPVHGPNSQKRGGLKTACKYDAEKDRHLGYRPCALKRGRQGSCSQLSGGQHIVCLINLELEVAIRNPQFYCLDFFAFRIPLRVNYD